MKIGQIVEIPENSSIYKKELPLFNSKEGELSWKIKQREYSLFDGFIVGEHQGVENFEIGQRKGLNVVGKKFPVYVIGIDEQNNRLFVGQGKNHPGLFSDVLYFTEEDITWLSENIFTNDVVEVEVISSHLENKIKAFFYKFGRNYFLEFDKQIAIVAKNYTIGLSYENKIAIELNK